MTLSRLRAGCIVVIVFAIVETGVVGAKTSSALRRRGRADRIRVGAMFSGTWDFEEYEKLRLYDLEAALQRALAAMNRFGGSGSGTATGCCRSRR